jgi:hypothetical protein
MPSGKVNSSTHPLISTCIDSVPVVDERLCDREVIVQHSVVSRYRAETMSEQGKKRQEERKERQEGEKERE